ncbi:protein 4.1b isoform X2 [Denticeps clupeoides]|uniref:protein 4.1b isoform X2 n=1 Tax=Denticeps clupeoides TaxID=299321 RepID=UPI0010A30004|nr:uncharacterized protein LOC114790499 isoform X2 [Denticeps clupeoides]
MSRGGACWGFIFPAHLLSITHSSTARQGKHVTHTHTHTHRAPQMNVEYEFRRDADWLISGFELLDWETVKMRWRVTLLDNREKEWNLPTNATGQDLFDEVCECLNLLERDYYGLAIWDSQHTKTWLDVSRQIIRQVSGNKMQFVFSVKFYPPDPTKITEDITRYLLCLQLRKEILTGRLPCPSDTLPVLGSFILQSEFGQYDPDLLGDAYIRGLYLAPNQKSEDLQRMKELHQTYGSMSAAQADFLFLQNVKQLRMYGTDLHPAKDSDGEDVLLGVCSAGVVVYKEDEIENKFMWPRVLKLSYRRARFLIKTRPLQGDEWTTVFTLSSFRACKRLWKVCVEHHGFFRLSTAEPSRLNFLPWSKFRFHGHTEAESLRASADVTRPAPLFSRRARPNTAPAETLLLPNRRDSDWFLVLDTDQSTSLKDAVLDMKEASPQSLKREADDWVLLLCPSPHRPVPGPPDAPPAKLQIMDSGGEQRVKVEEDEGEAEGGEETVEITQQGVVTVRTVKKEVKVAGKRLLEEEMRRVMQMPSWGPEKRGAVGVRDANEEETEEVVVLEEDVEEMEGDGTQVSEAEIRGQQVKVVRKTVQVKISEGKVMDGKQREIQTLKRRLQELDVVGERLLEVQNLKERLQEVDVLERRLRELEQQQKEAALRDDWFLLLDLRPPETYPALASVFDPRVVKCWWDEDDWFDLFGHTHSSPYAPPPRSVTESHILVVEEVGRAPIISPPTPMLTLDVDRWLEMSEERRRCEVERDTRRLTIMEERQKLLEALQHIDDTWFLLLDKISFEHDAAPSDLSEMKSFQEDDWFKLLDRFSLEGQDVLSELLRLVHAYHPEEVEEDEEKEKERELEKERLTKALMKEEERLMKERLVGEEKRRREQLKVEQQTVQQKEKQMMKLMVEEERKRSIYQLKLLEALREIEDDWFMFCEKDPPTLQFPPLEETSLDQQKMRADDWFMLLEKLFIEPRISELMRRVDAEEKAAEVERMEKAMEMEEERRRRAQLMEQEKMVKETERIMEEERHRREEVMEENRRRSIQQQKLLESLVDVEDVWFMLLDKHLLQIRPLEETLMEVYEEKQVKADDWFIFFDKLSAEMLRQLSVPVSPPALVKPRPQPALDQPFTSTPTLKPTPVTRPITTVRPAPVVKPTALERPAPPEEPKVEEEILHIKKRLKKVKGENIYVRHSMLMLENFDVTQDVVLQHHASIRELKRIFMEAVPEPQPSEWEQHLSIHTSFHLEMELDSKEEL